MTTREEVEASFALMLKGIACPECDRSYTDAAVQWSNAWHEGRRDLLEEIGSTERDGPLKIRCELCKSKAWINYFQQTASLIKG
jgi:hypothetical protein